MPELLLPLQVQVLAALQQLMLLLTLAQTLSVPLEQM